MDTSPRLLGERMQTTTLIRGQLITPLTAYADAGGEYAMDNGAFSGLDRQKFWRLLMRQRSYGPDTLERCLFVACPDIVGSGRRTLEIWKRRESFITDCPEYLDKFALVAQDGMEDMDIPWNDFRWLFVGGGDPWKDSRASRDIVKTAKALGKSVHVGRVNEIRRYRLFAELGCDTCDGSGVAMYDHMLEVIQKALAEPEPPTLF